MSNSTLVTRWLWTVAGAVFLMVVIGGLTRLTESGLSMVNWRPVTGWLPPLDEAAWRAVFDAYRDSPEYREINAGMSLDDFKGIFWLEYIHRLWGRLIGVLFALPLIVFAARGMIGLRLGGRLAAIFVLGGLQGVLGWYMVQSGLADQPWVSPYRLTAHFGLAMAVLALIVWTALDTDAGPRAPRPTAVSAVALLAFATLLSGASVAGNDAGLTYNTFPLMDGALVPAGVWSEAALTANLFDDIQTVQFNHRVLATLTAVCVLGVYIARRRAGPMPRWGHAAAAAVVVQYVLGIATLLSVVAIPVASAHQAVGTLLLVALVGWSHAEGRSRAVSGFSAGARTDGNPVAG
jgi:cytochrome c oxidase assembly protein subunit 15